MSFRLSCGFVPAAVAFGLCCGTGQLRAADSPASRDEASEKKAPTSAVEQLESSRPARPDLLNRIPRKPDTIQSLFGERGSAPAPLQVIGPGMRKSDLLDKEDDWAFITPEEVIHDYVMKEILKMPRYGRDGSDRSRLSAVERYYERLPHGGEEKPKFELDLFGLFGEQKTLEDQERPDESSGTAGLLAVFGQRPALVGEYVDPVFGADSTRPDMPPGFVNPTANRENQDLTPEAIRDRKMLEAQLNALRTLWDFQPPVAPAPTWSPLGQFSTPGLAGERAGSPPVAVGSSPFAVAVSPPISPFGPAPAPASPALFGYPKAPGAPDQADASQAAPGVNNTRPQPPKAEFSVPQRRF